MMNTIPFTSFAGLFDLSVGPIAEIIATLYDCAIMLLSDVGYAAADIMNKDGESILGQASSLIEEAVGNFMPSLQGIGYGISIMFFLFNFLNMVTTDNLTLEQFIKKFCWLFVGIALVSLAPTFYEKIIQFGDAFTKMIADKTFGPTENEASSIINKVLQDAFPDKISIADTLIYICTLIVSILIPLLMILGAVVLYVIVYIIAVTRALELNVRGAFLPIGLSLFSDEGWRGAGGRYLRKFFAVAAQGAGIAMIGKVMGGLINFSFSASLKDISVNNGNVITGDVITLLQTTVGLLKGTIVAIGIGCACVMAMFKVQQIISDVFGAQ